jgi:hypothetical protein
VEPVLGLGVRHESIRSFVYDGDELFRASNTEVGPVAGLETAVRLHEKFQGRGIVWIAAYSEAETRVKLDLQYVSPDADAFLSCGLHLTWKDHGRIERMVYLGAGVGNVFVLNALKGPK